MTANNTIQNHKPEIHVYNVFKYNKHDTIYQKEETNPKSKLLTEFVKVEKFQGFSKAYNLGLYFRIKNESSWQKSKNVTGLWKTMRDNLFFGDSRNIKSKTLLIFHIDNEGQQLTVFEFPEGYYPNRVRIDKLINSI